MNGQTLEEVDQFKYLGSTQTKDGTSVKEVKIRLAQAHSAMARLAILWKNKAISFPTKIVLYRSLVLSVLLYGCEGWTLTADLERRIQAFENKCFRRMLGSGRQITCSQVIELPSTNYLNKCNSIANYKLHFNFLPNYKLRNFKLHQITNYRTIPEQYCRNHITVCIVLIMSKASKQLFSSNHAKIRLLN